MSKLITKFFFTFILFIIFISIFFIPIFQNINSNFNHIQNEIITTNPNGFVWPIPGYMKISSPFGKRNSPTAGASSFHYGCDIPAPPGTKLIAVHDGTITFSDFLGAGGFTLTLSFDNFKISYCHIDPKFMLPVETSVKQGEVIAFVGPKNVYGVSGNMYKDSNGKPTNGATTGPHLHIGFRINNKYANPMDFF